MCNKCKYKSCICKNIITIQKFWRGYNIRNRKVFEPLSSNTIKNICDTKELTKIISRYLSNDRLEYYLSTNTKNIQLESGFSEYWIAKIKKGKRVGEGNEPIDVITQNGELIDVMCLCLTKNKTNEKSIIQKFGNTGNNLDTLFNKNDYKKALNIYLQSFYKKMKDCKEKYKNNDIYYYIFISTNKNVYLTILKVNIDNIYNINVLNITKKGKSINIKNFINQKYGTTKLYKSKKRIELRLNKNILDNHSVKLY